MCHVIHTVNTQPDVGNVQVGLEMCTCESFNFYREKKRTNKSLSNGQREFNYNMRTVEQLFTFQQG